MSILKNIKNNISVNSNLSEKRTFYIDLSPPTATNIFYSPNSTDYVDPNTTLTFNATVVDNRVDVDTVILQYYNGTTWENVTMSNNSATNYNASITTITTEAKAMAEGLTSKEICDKYYKLHR